MNALWEFDTRLSMCLDSRFARILEASLANECMRLMGLKSLGLSAISVFGNRMMLAEFIFSKGPVFRL